MKIALDKKKYRKRFMSLLFLSTLFSFTFMMIIIMNIVERHKLDLKIIVIAISMLLMLALFIYLTRFYYCIKRARDFVIEFENGVLNDYSKPFNHASFLSIDNIKSITFWRETQGIIQFKIVTKKENEKHKGLINQLKGNHFYISDYVVDSDELLSLVKLIENNI